MKSDILSLLDDVLESRKLADPGESYTAELLSGGQDKILKKLGEEAIELIIASKSGKNADIIHETADLWFHILILLKHHELGSDHILAELERRFGLSGHEEKANREKP